MGAIVLWHGSGGASPPYEWPVVVQSNPAPPTRISFVLTYRIPSPIFETETHSENSAFAAEFSLSLLAMVSPTKELQLSQHYGIFQPHSLHMEAIVMLEPRDSVKHLEAS